MPFVLTAFNSPETWTRAFFAMAISHRSFRSTRFHGWLAFVAALLLGLICVDGYAAPRKAATKAPEPDEVIFDVNAFVADLPPEVFFKEAGTPNGNAAMAKLPPGIVGVPFPADGRGGEVLKHVPPRIPRELRRDGCTGKVELLCLIGSNGNVLRAFVVSASTPDLAKSVAAAVMRWRFKSLALDGTKVPFITVQSVEISMERA